MFLIAAVVLFVAAEFVLGWLAIPVLALILGAVGAHRRRVTVTIAVAALLAWVILFAWTGVYGNLGGFMHALASSMTLAPVMLTSVALLLPVLLAWPAARLGAGLRPQSRAAGSDRIMEGRPAL